MAAPDILRDGFLASSPNDSCCDLRASQYRHGLLATVWRRLSLVVEVLFQLRLCRTLSVLVQSLVPRQSPTAGRRLASGGVFDVHGND